MNRWDKDHDGGLNFEEFRALMLAQRLPSRGGSGKIEPMQRSISADDVCRPPSRSSSGKSTARSRSRSRSRRAAQPPAEAAKARDEHPGDAAAPASEGKE